MSAASLTARARLLGAAAIIGVLSAAPLAAQVATNVGYGAKLADGGRGVPLLPDQMQELKLKIEQPFTVVALGDMLQFQPFANTTDPRTAGLIDHVRRADVAVADFENEIYDFDTFGHAGGNLGTKEVADDWKLMGVDMVSRANNKDTRAPGVWENLRQAERVGITHVGVARSLPEARMARYFSTPKGLVGFIGVASEGGVDSCCSGGEVVTVTPAQLARLAQVKVAILARRNEVEVPVPLPKADPAGSVSLFGATFRLAGVDGPAGEKTGAEQAYREVPPGAQDGFKNAIHLKIYHGVTADQMTLLREIAKAPGSGDLSAFGTQFRVMDRPGEHSFDMDPKDLREVLIQIRTAKQASDILLLNMHWHQNRYDFQAYSHDHFPADFEIKFAHDAIDQGVDMFAAQGVHTIKGVEIYKGKPIFYGISNFIFQSAIMPEGKGKLPDVPGQAARTPRGGGPRLAAGDERGVGQIDETAIVGEHERQGFWQLKANLESLMAESVYDGGRLKEVRIYPIDLGQTPRPGSQVGIPRTPTPAVARKILDELIEYSRPFGTKIVIENNVAVIRQFGG